MDHIFIKIDKLLFPFAAGYVKHVCISCDEVIGLAYKGELERASFIAHKMKGEGAAFGLDEVSAAGEEMTALIAANDSDGVKARANALKAYLERVRII